MEYLKTDLGKVLSAQEVAEYLKVDKKTVRKYYLELGGIRLGSRYRFFEKEIIYAISKRKEMDCPSKEKGNKEGTSISNEERRHRLGNDDETNTRRRLDAEDRHNIFG